MFLEISLLTLSHLGGKGQVALVLNIQSLQELGILRFRGWVFWD